MTYRPSILGVARVNAMLPDGGSQVTNIVMVAPLSADAPAPDWSSAPVSADAPPAGAQPAPNASFAPLPPALARAGTLSRWGQALVEAVYRTQTFKLFESKRLRLTSKPGESERDFRIRIADATRSTRDGEVDALRQKYAARLQTLEGQIQRAEQAVAREKAQATGQSLQTAVSVGATLLSAFLGGGRRTATIGRATTAARGFERAVREQGDVGRANESLESLRQRRDALAQEVEQAVAELTARLEGGQEPLTEKVIRPRKADIEVVKVALLWTPQQ